MIFRQYQLSCLSLISYLIGDEGGGFWIGRSALA